MDGKKILHNGGSIGYFVDEYKKIRYDTMNVDVAILYHHFLSDSLPNGKTVIDNYIKPKNILLGHIGKNDASFMDSLEFELKDDYPSLSVFTKSGQSWSY